jgi:hypothetical protein
MAIACPFLLSWISILTGLVMAMVSPLLLLPAAAAAAAPAAELLPAGRQASAQEAGGQGSSEQVGCNNCSWAVHMAGVLVTASWCCRQLPTVALLC